MNKTKKCCANCENGMRFSETYFGGEPVEEPTLTRIRNKRVCGLTMREYNKDEKRYCKGFERKKLPEGGDEL